MVDHYYSSKPQSAFKPFKIPYVYEEKSFGIWSAPGIFSAKEIDFGTSLLISSFDVSTAKSILDLGCGNGIVGVCAKLKNTSAKVVCSDVNERAIYLTQRNSQELKLELEVVQSNVFEGISEKFDVILTNPPYSAGRDICYAFIDGSFSHLNKGGSLQLVARHQKGGKMLSKKMEDVFGNVEVIGQRGGFRVYRSKK